MKELVRTREHAKHMRQQYEGKISEMETEVQQVTVIIVTIITTTIITMTLITIITLHAGASRA
jgi:hypothetical protein